MGRNADMLVKVVGENPDATVTIIGDQTIEATPADVGKVVTVDADGNLVLDTPSGGGDVASVDGRTGAVTLGDLYDASGAAAAAQAASAPKATPLPFKSVIDTSNRTKAGTTFAPMTGIAGIALTLAVGQVVELISSGYFSQSGASGTTAGRGGFVVDQPASADVNLICGAVISSADPGGNAGTPGAWFTATEAGVHTFYLGMSSGNASNIEANGASIPTRFSAKVLGTPTA